jgi:hypothetical protein
MRKRVLTSKVSIFIFIQITGIWIAKSCVAEQLHGRALLPEMPNKVMIRFQKAIGDSAWAKALDCCSNKIKSKAEEYGSVEAFFNDFLPINEVTALSEFRICSTRSRDDEIVSYSCEIQLKDPNYRYPLDWNLSVLKEGPNWVVEFPTKPLNIWLKHEILKMKVANEHLRTEPEKSRAGFDVRLIPLTQEFAIGSPMLFRVEMKNISDETLEYVQTSFMVNNPMVIKDSNGDIVPYIDTSYQTIVAPEFVEPGETIILADSYDVRSQYHITKMGKYTFQFRGLANTKPSNIVEKYVESKPLPALESIVEDILSVLPEGWELIRKIMSANKLAEASTANEVVWINLIGKLVDKGKGNFVIIAVFLNNAAQEIPQVKLKSHLSELEYWGQSRWGLIYGKSQDAEQLWPDYKERIINALDVQKVNNDKADASEKDN